MTSKIYTITAAFDAAELKKQNVLGKKIAESRVSSGMSQKELAGKLASYNISISPASIIETSTRLKSRDSCTPQRGST